MSLSLFVASAGDRGVTALAADNRVKSGTGFFVSPDGYLLTSAHVIAGCAHLAVWAEDGVRRAAQIVAADAKLDIALLWVASKAAHYAHAPYSGERPVGDEVFALGYGVIVGNPRRPVPIRGVYVGTDINPPGVRVRVIDARLQEGESGGAVLDADGGLFGMVIGRYTERPDHGVILPFSDIAAFLSAHQLPLAIALTDGKSAPQDVLMTISVLVQCVPTVDRNSPPPRGKQPSPG